jgi:hypothetical protein
MSDPMHSTGAYDITFFDAQAEERDKATDHMAAAKTGLSLFMEEATQALKTDGLTVDQRFHLATLVSYIEALASRFDIVRRPGFVHPPPRTRSRRT